MTFKILAGVSLLVWTASGQACAKSAPSGTVVATGFTARKIATVVNPRSMTFDKDGHLLVVSAKPMFGGSGANSIEALTLSQGNGCVAVSGKSTVVRHNGLTHGLALSADGKTIYASTEADVLTWPYDSRTAKANGSPKTIIRGMKNPLGGHRTRTLEMSKKVPGTLLVSHGSDGNNDAQCRQKTSGHCQIRAFDVRNATRTYNYATESDGNRLIGWGLRNSVGVAEAPDGGIWSNENGFDNMRRDSVDIHNDSPGEEINFHGYLNRASPETGANFGYPECHASWNIAKMPRNEKLTVGSQFSINAASSAHNDAWCAKNTVPPRIALPSHWAPIDIKFNTKGTVAYMTARGSWNRQIPDGYQLFAITFANGKPTHPSTSRRAVIPIFQNEKALTGKRGGCPSGCFRPTGLAFDSKGRLYMASDATNSIYVIERSDGKSVDSADAATLEQLPRRQAPTTPQKK
jgi:glucose/arabinose dehydrogenase